ncbi:ATP-binding protein [Amycolatopsis sp. WAC 04182]|uniref:ATP-binding protein n=1 Tax=Amycolatopsis sp. WAC 04182 TaxID=2203198 RepID=UPI00272B6A42|nr:ATP-binding protein [Amycolatopsis sp. WAC 04182]
MRNGGHSGLRSFLARLTYPPSNRIDVSLRNSPCVRRAQTQPIRRGRRGAKSGPPVLDDFGMRELTATQADDLYELISERATAGRSLILTSNRSPVDWYPLFPNPVVAESLLDRLINTSHQVFMNGPSYRPNKRPKQGAQPAKEAAG